MRRVARAVLVFAVRGRRDRGGPWGEAILAEFEQTRGSWQAVSWSVGGLRAVVQERFSAYAPSRAARLVTTAALGVVSMLVINQYALTAGTQPSGGMEPTIPLAGHFLLDKLSPQVTGVFYGDVVQFSIPSQPDYLTLKRVVGLPGDTITCGSGRLLRNGVTVQEAYLSAGMTTDCGPTVVPPDSIYVLGDNRVVSMDSRQWGPIPESAVQGRLLVTF